MTSETVHAVLSLDCLIHPSNALMSFFFFNFIYIFILPFPPSACSYLIEVVHEHLTHLIHRDGGIDGTVETQLANSIG